jgi:hypothetical protein
MKIRLKDKPKATGFSMGLNTHAMAEVIVGFDDDESGQSMGMDSCFLKELQVLLKDGTWKDLEQAFKDKDVITDNYNTDFREPENEEEKEKGWY